MFNEVKGMLPVSGDAYDREIALQINAAALDLTRTAEIVMPGVISISVDAQTGDVSDASTVTDELITTAIATWCAARIGNPPNYDKLISAYEMLKGNMRLSHAYSNYEEE